MLLEQPPQRCGIRPTGYAGLPRGKHCVLRPPRPLRRHILRGGCGRTSVSSVFMTAAFGAALWFCGLLVGLWFGTGIAVGIDAHREHLKRVRTAHGVAHATHGM